MKKLRLDTLNTRDFKFFFEGQATTLMSAHALRKEFALLRKACKPLAKDTRPGHQAFLDDHLRLATWLDDLLPASPGAADTVRDTLAPLPPSEKWLLLDALQTVQAHLNNHPHSAPLFLVPARWSARMKQAVIGNFYPAQIGIWGLPVPAASRYPPDIPLSHRPPSYRAGALLDAALHHPPS